MPLGPSSTKSADVTSLRGEVLCGVGSNWGMWGTGVGRLCAFMGVVSRGRV